MKNQQNKPLGPERRGFDFLSLARCSAKNRLGGRCMQAAMKNDKCYFHGGKSTGPKTKKGKARSSKNALKHGAYSCEELDEDKRIQSLVEEARQLYAQF